MGFDIKSGLIRVRASQPFNWLATSVGRACLGSSSEWLVKHLPRSGTASAALPNGRTLKLRSHGDDWVSNQVFWRGWSGYEPESTPLFYGLATGSRVTLDLGAHVGFYALLAGHANPAGKVYAFEPMPVTFARLRANIALNGLPNVVAVNSAVGGAKGVAEFYHGPTDIPCSCGLSPDIFAPGSEVSSFEVLVTTVDDLVREEGLQGVGLVKIDVEGAELDVLRGMAETLRRDRPEVICEVWGGPGPEMLDFLAAHGYRAYSLDSGPRPYVGDSREANHLFSARSPEEVLSARGGTQGQ